MKSTFLRRLQVLGCAIAVSKHLPTMKVNSTVYSRVVTFALGFNIRLTLQRVSWAEPR